MIEVTIDNDNFLIIENNSSVYVQRMFPKQATHNPMSEQEEIICKLCEKIKGIDND